MRSNQDYTSGHSFNSYALHSRRLDSNFFKKVKTNVKKKERNIAKERLRGKEGIQSRERSENINLFMISAALQYNDSCCDSRFSVTAQSMTSISVDAVIYILKEKHP